MSPPLRQLEETPSVATLLATVVSSIAVATAASSSSGSSSSNDVYSESRPHTPPNGECRLLGPFALIVQLALGALALLVLVYKRWRERPQRPVKIWAFDVSKQVVGSVLLHMANLVMSMLSSGKLGVDVAVEAVVGDDGQESDNPCSFYFLNLLIDVSGP